MRRVFLIVAMTLVGFASPTRADILYQFTVDTINISGTAGSLDFNFNPGPLATQAALLDILSFTSDGTLVPGPCASGGRCLTGDASGTLPTTVTLGNGSGFNDYFQGFAFASYVTFDVRLYGPAVNSPDGISTSGSTFVFSMFADAAGTTPTLTTDIVNGFASTIDVNRDGTATLTDFSSQTAIRGPLNSVPEPTNLPLLIVMVLALAVLRRRWFLT